MLNSILAAAGIPSRDGSSPAELPANTVVYVFDSVSVDGPDRVSGMNTAPYIASHQVHLEMYSPTVDTPSESALEKQLLINGLLFTKSAREWAPSVQRYLTVYELTYTTKI